MYEAEIRHWAIRLLALGKGDREWILSRVDEATGIKLRGLLDELSQLGLQVDSSMLKGIFPRFSCDSGDREPSHCADNLDTASPQSIAVLLGGEPNIVRRIAAGASPAVRRANACNGDYEPSGHGSCGDEIFPMVSERVRRALIRGIAKRIDGVPDTLAALSPQGNQSDSVSMVNIVGKATGRLKKLVPWKC